MTQMPSLAGRCRIAVIAVLALAGLVAGAGPARAAAGKTADAKAAAATKPAAEPTVVIIFPFESPDDGRTGAKFADRLRLRAKRLGLVIVDHLSVKEAMGGSAMPTLETRPPQMADVLKDRFAATIGLWGKVEPEGRAVVMHFRGLNLEAGGDQLTVSVTRRADEPQQVNPIQDEILEELTGRRKKPVVEATPEADAKVPTTGPELVANGGFETGTKTPDGWQRLDGLTTFWSAGGAGGGKCLRIFTDVYHDQWMAWQKTYKAGADAADAPKPTPTTGPKYNTVAGIYGVAFDSRPIPVTPGKAYKVGIQFKGKSTDFFFPKLFIRGWGEVDGEKRVVYDAYLALRCVEGGDGWRQAYRICEIPTDTQAPVEYLVLKVYAYWPPGTYYFDNVTLKEVAPGATIPGPSAGKE